MLKCEKWKYYAIKKQVKGCDCVYVTIGVCIRV